MFVRITLKWMCEKQGCVLDHIRFLAFESGTNFVFGMYRECRNQDF